MGSCSFLYGTFANWVEIFQLAKAFYMGYFNFDENQTINKDYKSIEFQERDVNTRSGTIFFMDIPSHTSYLHMLHTFTYFILIYTAQHFNLLKTLN